jgi:hypothetical protein
MQNVEYVKYNTTTDQTNLKQTTVVVGGRVNQKEKGYHHSNKYYRKAYSAGSASQNQKRLALNLNDTQ